MGRFEHDLDSWKAIADFLGVSERTAQNWEKERGLPVKRAPGPRGRVCASSEALTDWKNSNIKNTGRFHDVEFLQKSTIIVTVFALLLLTALIAVTIRWSGNGPNHNSNPPQVIQDR